MAVGKLRGKKPTEIQKRLKAMWFGEPGTFKTVTSLQFPRPYLVDTEKGSENDLYVKLLTDADGLHWPTTELDELIEEVVNLIALRHPYKTLVIDPLTTLYNNELDKAALSLATREDPTGTAFSRHKAVADRKMKRLLNLLARLDMNVIITSHAKLKWEGGEVVGTTFDCYAKLEYLFDLVLEVRKRGGDRVAIVRKTRLGGFSEGATFPFSYAEIANRYGRETFERDAVPVALTSVEQAARLRELLALRKNGDELLTKWLERAQSASIEEMPAEAAQKCIDYLVGGAATQSTEAPAEAPAA